MISRAPVVVEQRQHDQNRVGAGDPRFGDLARIDEEVLGEDRPVELAARGREVVERSAEIGSIAQDAERIGDAGITARERCRVRVRPDRAGRGGGLLDLEDEARAIPGKSPDQAALRRHRLPA